MRLNRFSKRAQVTIEFTLIIVFMMLLMSTLFVALEARMVVTKDSRNLRTLSEVANLVVTEVNLANKLGHGYKRDIFIPQTLNGQNYSLEIMQGVDLVVSYENLEYVTFLDVPVCNNAPPRPPCVSTRVLSKGRMVIANQLDDVFLY